MSDPGWDHVMSGAAPREFWLEKDGIPGGADPVWQPCWVHDDVAAVRLPGPQLNYTWFRHAFGRMAP